MLRPAGHRPLALRLALALLNLGGLLLCGSLVALLRGFSLSWLHNASIALNGLAMLSLLLALGAVFFARGPGLLQLAALRANQLVLAGCLGLAAWSVAAKPEAAPGAAMLAGTACVLFGANILGLRRPAPSQPQAGGARPLG
ncbi:hypothetical protein HNP48_006974 [Acidovorax soli]|uniref:Uncharacterized protein n=1 Tax=Acidovorax soli TaxID=592050 RepID=A0A7X0PMB8_9BURK|nr:hypothetical protein [Acidovorax soli]MBB6564247.1 hypothetical protein [Acidovorax soli]